ncbi:hypothetical protein SAMN05421786_104247 [Chryseobacterium ureilyticum]|uniref:Uncharacterized protein n=1 Tax=Chryseobacterium ureilyticum TaxID=373668 RepID=A0A1N7P0H1_9FLAO|nr:hypothetical protein [Chryseobacterium ureilyticum]SIT04060.1 hypothetical protein SAMN05421786_104247 [Chryseobacterium ureilyticum]
MNTPLNTIFSWFETGDFPTEAQFKATFLSFYHKDDIIPIKNIEGFEDLSHLFASAEDFKKHLKDPAAHSGYLALLNASNLTATHVDNWKSKLGISNVATIDSSGQPGNVYTKIQVDGFVNGLKDADKGFASEIEKIKKLLSSNDLSLDELQEIVNFIKNNRNDIEALKAISGESREDKVKLILDYNWLGSPKNQQEFNKQIYDKILLISQTPTSAVVQVTKSTTFPNPFETENVIIQARDSVTGKKINVDDYATNQIIEIRMFGEIDNPINILILKVKL